MAAGPAGRSDSWSEAQSPKQAGWSRYCSESGHLVEDHTCHFHCLVMPCFLFFPPYPLHKVVYHLEMNKKTSGSLHKIQNRTLFLSVSTEKLWPNELRWQCSRSTTLNALHPLTPVQHSYFFISPENQKQLSTPVIWSCLNQYRSISWNTVSHDNKWNSVAHFKNRVAKCFTVRIKLTLEKSTYTIYANMLSNIQLSIHLYCAHILLYKGVNK